MNHKFVRNLPGLIEVQTCSWFDDGTIAHAGVHFVPAITASISTKLDRSWARWRRWYDNLPENRNSNYPAKADHGKRVAVCSMFPVGEPDSGMRLNLFYRVPIAV